jgi:hypothetical protein
MEWTLGALTPPHARGVRERSRESIGGLTTDRDTALLHRTVSQHFTKRGEGAHAHLWTDSGVVCVCCKIDEADESDESTKMKP